MCFIWPVQFIFVFGRFDRFNWQSTDDDKCGKGMIWAGGSSVGITPQSPPPVSCILLYILSISNTHKDGRVIWELLHVRTSQVVSQVWCVEVSCEASVLHTTLSDMQFWSLTCSSLCVQVSRMLWRGPPFYHAVVMTFIVRPVFSKGERALCNR